MKVKLDTPMLLTKAVELISELVTDVKIKVSEFGMSITAIDPANVALVNFRLPKTAFSMFESDAETLGVNLDQLKKILKRAGTTSALILEKKENALIIEIQDRIKRNFSLNLLELDAEEIDFNEKISRMEFISAVEINSVDLIASIEDCAVVDDACSFIIKDGKFIIEAKNMNSARSEFSSDEVQIKAEDSKARYSLEYLQKFVKASKLTDKTYLQFAQDHPLKMDVQVGAMSLAFVLAPRVENED